MVPIRLASERLPGKALRELAGRPVVHHLLDRVVASRHIVDPRAVVVCTTTAASDDPLVPVVEGYGCSVFRGAIDDVIRRFADAMALFDFDAVIQVNGDNPLSATEYMDATMDRLLAESEVDIVSAMGLPLGVGSKSFSRQAMSKVAAAYRTERNDTGFIYYFTKSGLCRSLEIPPLDPKHVHETARLTLDYDADLALFRTIFEALFVPGQVFGLAEVIELLARRPELVELNRHVERQYWQRTAEKFQLKYCDAAGTLRRLEL